MQATFVQDGNSIDYTPAVDVAAGDVVVIGLLVGIAKEAIKANRLGALAVAGVFDFVKEVGASTAIAVGALVYWDSTNQQATTVATDNTLIGKCIKAAADSDATVRVRMQ